jgi:hypothetical protein
MNGARYIPFAFAALSLCELSGFADAKTATIPERELASALSAAQLPKPWHVDQLAYYDRGPHWQVDLFYRLHNAGPDICTSDIVIVDVALTAKHYSVVSKESPRRLVALTNCDEASKPNEGFNEQFAELGSDVTDAELQAAVQAVFPLRDPAKTKMEFEAENLRRVYSTVTRDQLHWVEKGPNNDIRLSFWSKDLMPDLLVIRIDNTGSRPPFVSRENGPDIQPIPR